MCPEVIDDGVPVKALQSYTRMITRITVLVGCTLVVLLDVPAGTGSLVSIGELGTRAAFGRIPRVSLVLKLEGVEKWQL